MKTPPTITLDDSGKPPSRHDEDLRSYLDDLDLSTTPLSSFEWSFLQNTWSCPPFTPAQRACIHRMMRDHPYHRLTFPPPPCIS